MQTKDKTPRDSPESHNRSRPPSRASQTKPASKRPKESPASTQATPKRSATKAERLDFLVTGRQILGRPERANSLPGGCSTRRPSLEAVKGRKGAQSAKTPGHASAAHSPKSRDASLEDNLSLDLSQLSEFDDASSRVSRHGPKKRFAPASTSTPKAASAGQRTQTGLPLTSIQSPKDLVTDPTFDSCTSCSFVSSNSNYREGCSTGLDYSSVSPEYSAPSSTNASPRTPRSSDASQSQRTPQPSDVDLVSPRSQDRSASSCYMSWLDRDRAPPHRRRADDGEWASFWANYNSSAPRAPVLKTCYNQCPTPYRSETVDFADPELNVQESSRRSPDHLRDVNRVIRNEGLHLTPRETQNLIKAAHMLGSVLSKAINRNSRQLHNPPDPQDPPEPTIPDPAVEIKKKSLTLDLKDQSKPLLTPPEAEEKKRRETVTTQTDISLPNTKSAPRIFEKILRQLSRSSIEETAPQPASAERLD